ncbi:MAG: hypothetical protein ACYCWW_09395 [Deltaproteobacteria bacterium]
MKLLLPLAALALIALAPSCGGGEKPLPTEPQIEIYESGLYFGTDICEGTYIGTSPQNSLQFSNGGQAPLVVSGVQKSGDADGVFQVNGPVSLLADGGDAPVTQLASGETAFIQVIFTPKAQKEYTATLTITSNAANEPTASVPLRGVGVPYEADGGTVPDAGIAATCGPDAG